MTFFRRALVFVGIAWSIAGASLLINNGGPWRLSGAANAGWVPECLLPRVQQVDCSAAVQGMPKRALDDASLRSTRAGAYELGYNLGLVRGARSTGRNVEEPASLRQE